MKYNITDILSYFYLLSSEKLNELPLKTRYKFALILPILTPHVQFYEERQKEIADKYGKRDEEGNFVYTEEGKGIIIEEKFLSDFNKAIKELNDLSIELEEEKISCSLDDLEPLKLSIPELSKIISFIK